ncbi:MAG: hypothetical protein IRY85_03110 [Micromonosporaceae bacterium]|nr:hypothetical protein [Micromonosporaceae bacterium]
MDEKFRGRVRKASLACERAFAFLEDVGYAKQPTDLTDYGFVAPYVGFVRRNPPGMGDRPRIIAVFAKLENTVEQGIHLYLWFAGD